MKISYNWLKKYIALTETPENIARLLTQSGLEVESVTSLEPIPGGLKGLVLGQVLSCQKHPYADKLQYTSVDIGKPNPLAIVCGAANIQVGQQVIVAPVGTIIYPYAGNSMTIKQAKIRGLVSEGMICAEDEIGLSDNHQGIVVLDTCLPPGTPASKCFEVASDTILTIDITPNRADACSHLGIARELRAILNRLVQLPVVADLPANVPSFPLHITIDDYSACPRYAGVMVRDITVQASPEWLQNQLKAIGIDPINNIVDITNFVMHELGQPLHAFDYDQVVGNTLQIKTAQKKEQFVTLDGVTRQLTGKELVISDQAGYITIAGVLGGKRTSINESSKNICLESAYFSPQAIQATMHGQSIQTDAAFRYERGANPHITVYALQRAIALIQQIAPKATFSTILDLYPQAIASCKIPVYYKNITRLIGQAIPQDKIRTILNNLEIKLINEDMHGFIALVPPYRVDVTREVDIIEEILRIYGYAHIQAKNHLGSSFLAANTQPLPYHVVHELSVLLTAHGYYEICTNSLTTSAYTKVKSTVADSNKVAILNPISERLDILRQSLAFSGLEVIAHNINRQQPDLKLFEFGKIYLKLDDEYLEENKLGLWLTGNLEAPNWVRQPRAVTLQDLMAIIYQLLHQLGIKDFTSNGLTNNFYHPGLEITSNQHRLVHAGQLCPSYLQDMGIKQPVFFAELNWDLLWQLSKHQVKYQAISKVPIVKRDLSLVLDQAITFEQVKNLLQQQKEPLIQDMAVFDVYEGPALAAGKKAYALSFALQGKGKTLEEKSIRKVMQRLIHVFEEQLGAIIRE